MIYLRGNGKEEIICEVEAIHLRGRHNIQNVLAACAIAAGARFSLDSIAAGVRNYRGLPHRLEFVREVNGATWYNDSIATSPNRSIAAMQSFDEPLILLAGGRDKDLVWDEFAEKVSARVDHLILFGEASKKIAKAMGHVEGEKRFSMDICEGLSDAVEMASILAEPGDVVLLAPGGTSFDEFLDFVARGERFRELVEAL
jgi:UDP-N-acetylmuramoylalanine--D-glutamate ligase